MHLTNIQNLPQPLVNAVAFSEYSKGGSDFSVTELLKPARIAALEHLHADEIEEDASERIWLLLGSSVHEILRRSAKSGIIEERVEVEIDGAKVSGQMDIALIDQTLWDYKVTSAWSVKSGPRPEWEQQLNCYRWLASHYGVAIDALKIIAILRDWSMPEARRDASYPRSQVKTLDIPVWPLERTEQFLKERIAMHRAARAGNLPECTSEEVWEKPTKYAVMKKGNQRAVKLYDNEKDATLHTMTAPGLYLQPRPGERPRCDMYCAAANWCSQFAAWKLANAPTE